jgi:hypothetical protein
MPKRRQPDPDKRTRKLPSHAHLKQWVTVSTAHEASLFGMRAAAGHLTIAIVNCQLNAHTRTAARHQHTRVHTNAGAFQPANRVQLFCMSPHASFATTQQTQPYNWYKFVHVSPHTNSIQFNAASANTAVQPA